MQKISKGEATKVQIVEDARVFFNENGISQTIDALSKELGMTKSRISNHFPTKDNLFSAIIIKYEEAVVSYFQQSANTNPIQDFQTYFDVLSGVMDIQFQFRCAVIYLNVMKGSSQELIDQIKNNYTRNQLSIKNRIQQFVTHKILKPEILEDVNWQSFEFIYVNIITQWVVHIELYDRETDYQTNKLKYLTAIATQLYQPYLAPKGKQAFQHLIIR